jgi:hypothetical protein
MKQHYTIKRKQNTIKRKQNTIKRIEVTTHQHTGLFLIWPAYIQSTFSDVTIAYEKIQHTKTMSVEIVTDNDRGAVVGRVSIIWDQCSIGALC